MTVHDEWTVLIHGKEEYRHNWYVGCDPRSMLGCMGSLHNMETGFDTEEQAIAAWNTRAERTCHRVNVNGYSFRFECSSCGYVAIVQNCETRLDELPNYCPNCGARVVNENKPVEVWHQASADDVTCYGVEQ